MSEKSPEMWGKINEASQDKEDAIEALKKHGSHGGKKTASRRKPTEEEIALEKKMKEINSSEANKAAAESELAFEEEQRLWKAEGGQEFVKKEIDSDLESHRFSEEWFQNLPEEWKDKWVEIYNESFVETRMKNKIPKITLENGVLPDDIDEEGVSYTTATLRIRMKIQEMGSK